jgi:hypothetical protein
MSLALADHHAGMLAQVCGSVAKMAVARLASISIDCDDPSALAQFWADLVGGEVAFTGDDFVAVKTERGWLAAVRVPDYQPPSWRDVAIPKQMHIDLPWMTWTRRKRKQSDSGRAGQLNNRPRTGTGCCWTPLVAPSVYRCISPDRAGTRRAVREVAESGQSSAHQPIRSHRRRGAQVSAG